MMILAGQAYLSRSSNQVPVSLEIDAGTVTLKDATGKTLLQFDQAKLAFDARLGQADRRATLPDGTMFETADHQSVEALSGQTPGDLLHAAERFGPRLIIICVVALLGVFAVWRFALPAMVWAAVAMTPEPLKSTMDAGTLQAIDRIFAQPTELPQSRQDEVQALFNDLVDHLDDAKGKTFTLQFRHIPGIGPNAFAMPGGTIVLTDTLINDFPGEDVVAAVIGHELGHVVDDHGLTQLYRSLGFFVLVSLIAGETGPLLEDLILEGGVILSLQYSRAHETQADAFGVTLTQKAGYDPSALITFFQALHDSANENADWGSTHPASGARIKAIQDLIRQNGL